MVLEGEYESGYSGEKLTVLDIGANVGAFSIWANMRWPGSTIHAYEPDPRTFAMLSSNVAALDGVVCHQAAVYPRVTAPQPFHARYAGDGEAGLVVSVAKTFEEVAAESTFSVPVIAPDRLPSFDVVKIDVEGAEADIVENLGLVNASLILLEYQNDENRRRIERRLGTDFVCEHADSSPWSAILPGAGYRKELAGDHYGHLFFASRRANKLRKVDLSELDAANTPPLRNLLAALPGAVRNALRNRLRRLARRPAG